MNKFGFNMAKRSTSYWFKLKSSRSDAKECCNLLLQNIKLDRSYVPKGTFLFQILSPN